MRKISVAVAISLLLAGCDRLITPHNAQLTRDAEAKANGGDYPQAIALYEAALDGTTKTADVHYRLALLYDDKLHDPLHALHHFKRYLALVPNGTRANDAKKFMERDELALVTSMSGDAVVSRAEAARLRNENLTLQKQLQDIRGNNAAAIAATAKNAKKPGRTYVVRKGDTLASISRKFYKSSARWKRILDANRKSIDDPDNLKVGETLAIP